MMYNHKAHAGYPVVKQRTPVYVAKDSSPLTTRVITSSLRPALKPPIYGGCCGSKLPKR